MGHFIEKCKYCGVVISQCRCMDCNKETVMSVCGKCLEKYPNPPTPAPAQKEGGE